MHPLFIKIVTKNKHSIYFHKYFGLFTTTMPEKQQSLTGGILADEMGLGKTLEILSTIIINPRTGQLKGLHSIVEEKVSSKKSSASSSKEVFSCTCGRKPEKFMTHLDKIMVDELYDDDDDEYNEEIEEERSKKRAKISKKPKKKPERKKRPVPTQTTQYEKSLEENLYQCVLCKLWMHAQCVNYRGPRETFICLPCHEKIPPISSACTLIVTPSIISQQWADEIHKHLNKKLKVLFYKGANRGLP